MRFAPLNNFIYCNQVIQKLGDLPGGDILTHALMAEQDFVYWVKPETDIPNQHFQSRAWLEHSRWFGIPNKAEAETETVLASGILPGQDHSHDLMFSSRLGLEYLAQFHW